MSRRDPSCCCEGKDQLSRGIAKKVAAEIWAEAMSYVPRKDGSPDMRFAASKAAVAAQSRLCDFVPIGKK